MPKIEIIGWPIFLSKQHA